MYDKYLRLRGKGVNSEIISFLDFLSRKAAEFAKVLIAARRARRQAGGCLARLLARNRTSLNGISRGVHDHAP